MLGSWCDTVLLMCPCGWRTALATSGDKRWTSSPITLRCLENNEYIPACPMPQVQLWVPQKLESPFFPVLNAFTASEPCVCWSISFYLIVKLVTFQVLGVCPTIVVGRIDGQFLVISRNEETSLDLTSIATACGLCAVPGKPRISCVHSSS